MKLRPRAGVALRLSALPNGTVIAHPPRAASAPSPAEGKENVSNSVGFVRQQISRKKKEEAKAVKEQHAANRDEGLSHLRDRHPHGGKTGHDGKAFSVRATGVSTRVGPTRLQGKLEHNVANVATMEPSDDEKAPPLQEGHFNNLACAVTASSPLVKKAKVERPAEKKSRDGDGARSQAGPGDTSTSIRTVAGGSAAAPAAPADGARVVPRGLGLRRAPAGWPSFTRGIAPYDATGRADPRQCKDYVADMFQYFYVAETTANPGPYMHRQEDINSTMRAILVDWLVDVHMKFRFVPETLYLCVQIVDRYCSKVGVAKSELQLVGVTALLLACKHEEIYPPKVRECVFVTDGAYDRQEVLGMEQTLLRALDWRISLPTAYPFLDRFLSLAKASPMTRHAAAYYLERTLLEHELLKYRPSLVCAAVVILALNHPGISSHEEEHQRALPGLPTLFMEYTDFEKDKLMACVTVVAAAVSEPAIGTSGKRLTAVRKKYKHKNYLSVSSSLACPSLRFSKLNIVE